MQAHCKQSPEAPKALAGLDMASRCARVYRDWNVSTRKCQDVSGGTVLRFGALDFQCGELGPQRVEMWQGLLRVLRLPSGPHSCLKPIPLCMLQMQRWEH